MRRHRAGYAFWRDGGVRHLAQQIDRFGSVELGLAAYNAGPDAVTVRRHPALRGDTELRSDRP